MTQTGFNITTLYGTAALTGITGSYGSYGQTGTGTSTPLNFELADGEPNVSTLGGRYSGSQSGLVSGFVTPISIQTGYLFKLRNGFFQNVLSPENMTPVEEIGSFIPGREEIIRFETGDPERYNGQIKFN